MAPLSVLKPERKLHLDKIKRFSCISYVKDMDPDGKFSNRAIKAVFVGYSTTGYILWDPKTRKEIVSKHVQCNEKIVYKNEFKLQMNDETSENIPKIAEIGIQIQSLLKTK